MWVTDRTRSKKIDERKQLKNKLLHIKSPRLQDQIQKACKKKDKEVKRSARSDKRSCKEELAGIVATNALSDLVDDTHLTPDRRLFSFISELLCIGPLV